MEIWSLIFHHHHHHHHHVVVVVLFWIQFVVTVHGQTQTGFISIDCGARENFNYVDIDTGISYSSDGAYISTGINKNISDEYAYPNNPNLAQPLSDVRSFPRENKNCYTLRPTDGKGSLNLIRASFMYGNYDGANKLPEFDLYIDVNFWFNVKFRNASDVVITEIISVAASDTINVCLVNTGLGVPFISGLELRPLNSSIYNTESGMSGSLILSNRLNLGSTNGTGRYTDDSYDRIWSLDNLPSSDPISTSSEIDITVNGYRVPPEVIKTAVKPGSSAKSLEIYWTADDPNTRFYIYMYFAEIERIGKNQSRKFNILWNGSPLLGPFTPGYLSVATLSNTKALVGKEHRISIQKTNDSSLPPIINAMEIYMFREPEMLATDGGDADAITNVKTTYQVQKNWVGDPCGPKNYSWEGITCRYNDSKPSLIISLNLKSSNLSGGIAGSIAKLSSLESLDLSNNSLGGPIPDFLKDLHSLKYLNLKGNNLSGFIPSSLVDRSKTGSLTLSVDDQNLCSSSSCKKKKNLVVPLAAALVPILALSVLLIVIWRFTNLTRRGTNNRSSDGEDSLSSKRRRFSYAEVVSITKNFQRVIGKGGFGNVYHGTLEDGTQVAVKILSQSSKQGPTEFRSEAELLMRVHHRSLVSFIGYCNSGNNMALISQYMANGNLKDYISGKSSRFLNWQQRLGIAIDAAQGLEYLHHGCTPPIIHRDVKTANILISESLDAKIADFGLSKAFSPTDSLNQVDTPVMGTRGYLDPEYYISQKLNEKSDVYSFGIVLLELITGLPAIMKEEDNSQTHILEWVSPFLEKGEITNAVDQRMQNDYDVNSLSKTLVIAMSCTAPTSKQRPTMNSVVAELKECLAMEMSKNKERNPMVPKEHNFISSSNSAEGVSMDIDTMTAPFAR